MVRKIVLSTFSLIWIFVIFSEYLFQHSWYADAAQNFQYYGFLIPLLLAIGGFAWLWQRDKGKIQSYKALNGLGLFGLVYLIVMITTVIFFSKYQGDSLSLEGVGNMTGYFLLVALAIYLCIGFSYLLGDLICILFPLKMASRELFVVKIGVGIMLWVLLLFALGTVNLLHSFVLIPLFILIAFLNLRGGQDFVKQSLLKPLPLSSQLNLLGIASFAVTLTFVSLNFIQIIRPIPIGFDAMTLYMRIPSLIHDYHGLIQGNGPYYWSIFMSLGFVVFNSTAVTLGLSFIGGPLALFAIYALARRWMNTNLALLAVAIFYTMPEVNFLSYQDMKIDLGLLFISLCAVILLAGGEERAERREERAESREERAERREERGERREQRGRKQKASRKKKKDFPQLQTPAFILRLRDFIQAKSPQFLQEHGLMIWLGLFAGFAMGIKATSLLLLMGLLAALWLVKGNAWSSLGVILLCLFGVLLLRLDHQAGLRAWHTQLGVIQWPLAIAGIGLLIWQGLKDRQLLFANAKRSAVLLAFFLLMMSPWFIKNFAETKRLSSSALLEGKSAFPRFESFDMEYLKNYYNTQNSKKQK